MILQALMQLQGDIACGTFTLNLVACPLFVRYMWSLGNAGAVHSLNRADEVVQSSTCTWLKLAALHGRFCQFRDLLFNFTFHVVIVPLASKSYHYQQLKDLIWMEEDDWRSILVVDTVKEQQTLWCGTLISKREIPICWGTKYKTVSAPCSHLARL